MTLNQETHAELHVNSTEAVDRARKDFNFLAALAMPFDFLFNFPQFYLVLFSLFTAFEKKVERFAIGIPRGFAKTTFVKIICLWYILFSHKQFILIVAANEDKAKMILADIIDMLSTSNMRRLFGHWDKQVDKDAATTKVFHFRGREIILWAIGTGGSVRGINRKNKRPDVMLLDDIQDKELAANKELSEELYVWMLSTLMKAKSNFGCTYIFIGNMYPQNSILEKLKNNKHWTSLVVGGILQDMTSLWEELKPIEELIEEYEADVEAGHPEVFISEVLNSTDVPLMSGLDLSKIPLCPAYLLEEDPGEGAFVIIDPSSGKKDRDDCTINFYEVKDSKPILSHLEAGTFSPLQVIELTIAECIKRNIRAVFVESVAYQSTLLFWFDHICNRDGISGFQFIELSPKGQNKNNRIKKGATKLIAGEIYLHPSVRSLVMSQYTDWNPLKINNKDDIIDPIGYVEEVMQNHETEIVRNIFEIDSSTASAAHSPQIQMAF